MNFKKCKKMIKLDENLKFVQTLDCTQQVLFEIGSPIHYASEEPKK